MLDKNTFTRNESISWSMPNYWDILALVFVSTLIIFLVNGALQMSAPYDLGEHIDISLSPAHLPFYAIRTTLRLFIALFFSLVCTFVFGSLAAKSRRAERIIIPVIDVLQSLPVLSFLYITTAGFIYFFKGSLLGPECAAIFAIFTAQVWNMILSFYQSLKSIPQNLDEVALVYRLSPWRKFWRIEVPFAMPGLIWNMMMSMSGSWFFVTASEAFSVGNNDITLPGIGSYISVAISSADKISLLYAILAMFLVILLCNTLLFRPLVDSIAKYKEATDEQEVDDESILSKFIKRTNVVRNFAKFMQKIGYFFVDLPFLNYSSRKFNRDSKIRQTLGKTAGICLDIFFWGLILFCIGSVFYDLFYSVNMADVREVLIAGFYTALRVIILIVLCSLIWVPIGSIIGLNPRLTKVVQPIIQFLAAFPANLLFPMMAFLIIKYQLNVNIWSAPLGVLGTQWYILFNVIAGASVIPNDLKQMTKNFGVSGFLWWRKLILPSIFPYFITGAITAAGGAWNASIVAEVIVWGQKKLQAIGVGAYIAGGDLKHVGLGSVVMCIYVLLLNRLLWRPLYNYASAKFKLD